MILLIIVVLDLKKTGVFRSIDNTYEGDMTSYDIPGAEDFTISREDGFMIISSDDRAARRDQESFVSGLYYMDLETEEITPLVTSKEMEIYPHGIHMIKTDSAKYRVLAINHISKAGLGSADIHADHPIEEFILEGKTLRHIKSYRDDAMMSPNDIVAIDQRSFYFTNDHGSTTELGLTLEDYLGLKRSNVVYYDGSDYREVASGIAYANGICADLDRDLLYVASPRHTKVLVYNMLDDGSLEEEEVIACGTSVDNIELDEGGKLWIGCHPSAFATIPYFAGDNEYAPSEVITIDYRGEDDFDVASIYESDGRDMSASTVAVTYKDKVYVGNVMDDHFISMDRGVLDPIYTK